MAVFSHVLLSFLFSATFSVSWFVFENNIYFIKYRYCSVFIMRVIYIFLNLDL